MSKYLYVDSEGRVCRIDAETGAMIPIEWETADERAAKAKSDGRFSWSAIDEATEVLRAGVNEINRIATKL